MSNSNNILKYKVHTDEEELNEISNYEINYKKNNINVSDSKSTYDTANLLAKFQDISSFSSIDKSFDNGDNKNLNNNIKFEHIQENQEHQEQEIFFDNEDNDNNRNNKNSKNIESIIFKNAEEEDYDIEETRKVILLINEYIYDVLIDCKDEVDKIEKNMKKQDNYIFISKKIPSLSIEEYIQRLALYAKLEENELIFMIIILKTIRNNNDILFSIRNIYKLLNVSLILTVKYLKDKRLKLSDYCRITGESSTDLFFMEYTILELIDFRLLSLENEFSDFKESLYEKYIDYI